MAPASEHISLLSGIGLPGGKVSMFTTSIMLVAGCIVMATSIFTAIRPLRMVSPF